MLFELSHNIELHGGRPLESIISLLIQWSKVSGLIGLSIYLSIYLFERLDQERDGYFTGNGYHFIQRVKKGIEQTFDEHILLRGP